MKCLKAKCTAAGSLCLEARCDPVAGPGEASWFLAEGKGKLKSDRAHLLVKKLAIRRGKSADKDNLW